MQFQGAASTGFLEFSPVMFFVPFFARFSVSLNTVRVKIITGSLVTLENLFPKITVTVTVLKFG